MTSPSSSPPPSLDLFDDTDFYPPTPPPTTASYTTAAGETLTLRLVGHSPLEAHHLWNGARVAAAHLEAHAAALVAGRAVLELGAGAGLPSLVAAARGARVVVATDFPDPDLLENLWRNVRACTLLPPAADPDARAGNIVARGYVWGADPAPLLACVPPAPPGEEEGQEQRKFDVVVLADLLFRHSEHGRLLDSVGATLKRARAARALVFFTSYRPWLAHKDLAFFDRARARGLAVDKLFERRMDRPLFADDPGDEEVRRTVLAYALRWPDEACCA
ncbi:hypothetical protein P8C59_008729 [Phyllachora maydis]|uniref:Protein N-terminal and lysine N-methyltransferase EFM7 n=1 Tax=Phyllachora maydis TaxID=1825666 RepID=A0AAD9IC15_9PEZI|nr:hypothetical protein P8C59_008729 [Phyllachora maydis]